MKKITVILILLLLIPGILSQSLIEQGQDLQDNIDNTRDDVEDIKDSLDPNQARADYLSKEWTKIFRERNSLNWIYQLDPIFKFLFGYEFTLSWAFVTALLLWLIFFFTFYPITNVVFQNSLYSFGISIPISVIASHSLTEVAIEKFSSWVMNIWHNFVLIIGLIFIMAIVYQLSGIIGTSVRKYLDDRKLDFASKEAVKSRKVRQGFESIKESAESMKKGYDKS